MRDGNPRIVSSHNLMILILCIQFVFGYPLAVAAQSPAATSPSQQPVPQGPISLEPPPNQLKSLAESDLNWEDFIRSSQQASEWKLPFNFSDPAMDQDPFFLRHQRWVKEPFKNAVTSDGSSPSPTKSEPDFGTVLNHSAPQSTTLQFEKSAYGLQLSLPLHIVATTEEFIFYSLHEKSDLFQKAAGKGQLSGEGLFFISKGTLFENEKTKTPVPLFYFPLPGQGWQGPLTSLEFKQSDQLIIANQENVSITLDLKDVEAVMLAQQLNLNLATAFSIQSAALSSAGPTLFSRPGTYIYPEPHSTAGFGMFFTAKTENFQWAEASALSRQQRPLSAGLIFNLFKAHPSLTALWPQQISAFNFQDQIAIPDHVFSRIIFIASVLAGMLMLSAVLKYAAPGIRHKVKSLREGPEPTTLKDKLRRETTEVFDVYAHVSTTSFQFINISFGSALEIFLDRFAPSVAAADHTLIRRFLSKTFYFARDSVKRTPVNAKTFFLGSVIIGGVESVVSFLNYFILIPWIGRTTAPHLNPFWQNKVTESLVETPPSQGIGVGDTMRKSLSAFQNGASRYAADSRQQIIEGVTKDVDQILRTRGRNPRDPTTQSLRNRLIEEKADKLLQQRGLPAQKRFLFDAHTLVEQIPENLGFKMPLESAAEEGFVLARRFALTKHALDRAIHALRDEALQQPSLEIREAIAILEETQQKIKLVSKSFLQGPKGFHEAKVLRQQLTLLSYEGPTEYAVRHLPTIWISQYSELAARIAAIYFRQSLYSYLDRDGMRLLHIPHDEVELVEKDAISNVIAEMASKDPEIKKLNPSGAFQKIVTEKSTEFNTHLFLEIQKLTRARVETELADSYTPPKRGFYERRQIEKAHKRTQTRMQETRRERRHLKKQFHEGSSDSLMASILMNKKNLRKRFFTEALAAQVGLHLKSDHLSEEEKLRFEEMLSYVELKAAKLTEGEIQHNQGLKTFLSKLSAYERTKIELSIYGANFLNCYKEAATERLMIDPISSMQPGGLQRLRQTPFVARSEKMSRFLRSLEALTDDQALELGFESAVRRNVPFFHDIWSTHRRLIKKFIPNVTIIFLWNYFMWRVPMSYGAWLLMVAATAGAIDAPSQFINRIFRLNGVKVMNSLASKIAFDLPALTLTFISPLVLSLFATDAEWIVKSYLFDPFLSLTAQLEPREWGRVGLYIGGFALSSKIILWIQEAINRYLFNRNFEKAMNKAEGLEEAEKHLNVKETLKLLNPSVVFMRCLDTLRRH